MHKKIFFLILAALAISTLQPNFGLADEKKWIFGNGGEEISDEDLKNLSQKALEGDGVAAFKVARYYDTENINAKINRFWLMISAEDGYPLGEYNYAFHLAETGSPLNSSRADEPTDHDRARFWFRRAKEHGLDVKPEVLRGFGLSPLEADK
jgi:TPR repeat protein